MRVTNDFVVARKLAELRRQRAALQQIYESLRAQAARTQDDYEAGTLLYHALREMRFAGQPVHPDIGKRLRTTRQPLKSNSSARVRSTQC